MKIGNYKEALDVYSKAYQIDPKRYEILFRLGYANQLLGKKDDAKRFYEEAIQSSQMNYQPYLNLGILLYPEDPKKAKEYLRKSLELSPGQPQNVIIEKSISDNK